MMMLTTRQFVALFVSFAAAATVTACDGPTAEPAANEPAPATEQAGATGDQAGEHFGAPFTMDESTPLADVLSNSDDYVDKTVKVTGRIDSVCAKKGCWFVMQDEGSNDPVRITMKDYGFFVPKDCSGKQATVEGTFATKTLTEAQRKHFAEDQGEDPSKIKGDKVEYSLVATGVEIDS